jgi:hypothetical protein
VSLISGEIAIRINESLVSPLFGRGRGVRGKN